MGKLIPVSKEICTDDTDFKKGNFGLWYNKYIPVSDSGGDAFCRPCDKRGLITGEKDGPVQYYIKEYNNMKQNAGVLINKKHQNQIAYLRSVSGGCAVLELGALLSSRLITGLGQIHPNETSIVLDHTTGIPYIPASTLKGIVRLGCIVEIIKDPLYKGNEYYGKDKDGKVFLREEKTPVRKLFGYEDDDDNEDSLATSGGVIFLDAYPEDLPSLVGDIINPHYGEYYKEKKAPADNQAPVPVKFLAVEKGVKFIFRIVVKEECREHIELLKKGFEQALVTEGIGAKTATGYGRFKDVKWGDPGAVTEKTTFVAASPVKEAPVEIKEGDIVKGRVLEVLADKSGVKVMLPNNQKAIIGKKQLSNEYKNNMKTYFKEGKALTVKILEIGSGNARLEFQGFDEE